MTEDEVTNECEALDRPLWGLEARQRATPMEVTFLDTLESMLRDCRQTYGETKESFVAHTRATH
jgi:hypothetical protein